MRKRALGKTGLQVSELALGTWGLSGDGYAAVTEMDQDRVIDRASALGITLYETADVYAHGAMERRLGERLPERAVIVTKIGTDRDSSPPRKRFDAAYLEEAFDRCQERIGRDPLDVVLLHNPSTKVFETEEASGVLSERVAQGRLKAWGVSVGSEEVGRLAIEQGASVIQLPYNAFYSGLLNDLADVVESQEVGVLARSVLAHGLLCGHWAAHKEFRDDDHRAERWTPDELRRRITQLSALRSVIGGQVLTMRAAALRYVLDNERVSSAVLGPRNAVQLDQLVREAGREPPYLGEEKLAKLATRLNDVGVNP